MHPVSNYKNMRGRAADHTDRDTMTTKRTSPGDASWYSHARFGLFIHWGIYAAAARHEWIKQYEEISDENYQPYLDHFDPDLYDPDEWARVAADAGMQYFVITTKHHDGFCLWDTEQTDYKITNTPHGRDLIAPMVDAFRNYGLRVGFYHSLIDWHHPDFTVDDMHVLRNHPDRAKLNEPRNWQNYIDYLYAQVRELLTDFGTIDVLFMDYSYPPGKEGYPADLDGKGKDDWQSDKLYKLIRQLQPDVMLNDRMDLDEGWDIKTPEQIIPRADLKKDSQSVTWEACHTFSGSWGYHRDEESWKSIDQCIRMLIDIVSKDGNLLMNVGPTARGTFDDRALERFVGYAEWMRLHKRSIYGCTAAPADLPTPQDCRFTYNPEVNRLYLHIFAWPYRHLFLDGFAGKVQYAQLLNDASEVKIASDDWIMRESELCGTDTLVLDLPVKQPDVTVPVVELFLK